MHPLKEWAFEERLNGKGAAFKIGTTSSVFSQIINGHILPTTTLALQIYAVTKGKVSLEKMAKWAVDNNAKCAPSAPVILAAFQKDDQ